MMPDVRDTTAHLMPVRDPQTQTSKDPKDLKDTKSPTESSPDPEFTVTTETQSKFVTAELSEAPSLSRRARRGCTLRPARRVSRYHALTV